MAKVEGPRPIIVEIAKPYELEIIKKHWSRGGTVTREYFIDLFRLVVGREYDGKLDKRSIAEALLLYAGGKSPSKETITDDMFSKGSTITNSYFNALKEALETCSQIERDGLKPSDDKINKYEMEEAANELQEGSEEGRQKLVSHFRRERSKALSLLAKRIARKKHPESLLVCEICNSTPEKTYQEDIIEAHHRTPLSQLTGLSKVMPADLAMICPNCHRAVHKIDNCSIPEISKRLKAAGLIK
jgi:hypothetical protein